MRPRLSRVELGQEDGQDICELPPPRVHEEEPVIYNVALKHTPAVLQELRGKAHEAAEVFAKRFMAAFGPQGEELYDMAQYLMEKHLLPIVMKECHGNQSEASRRLGLNRSTTRKKLRRSNVSLRRVPKDAST